MPLQSHGGRVSQAIRHAITGNVAKYFDLSGNGILGGKHSTAKYRQLRVSMWVKLSFKIQVIQKRDKGGGCSSGIKDELKGKEEKHERGIAKGNRMVE